MWVYYVIENVSSTSPDRSCLYGPPLNSLRTADIHFGIG